MHNTCHMKAASWLRCTLCCSAHWPASVQTKQAAKLSVRMGHHMGWEKQEDMVEKESRGGVAMMEEKGSVLGAREGGCSHCFISEAFKYWTHLFPVDHSWFTL